MRRAAPPIAEQLGHAGQPAVAAELASSFEEGASASPLLRDVTHGMDRPLGGAYIGGDEASLRSTQ